MKVAARKSPVDVMFKAFADRTRLRILHLLRGGELCVCELVRVLDVPQPKVSRHLAYLRKAGLVKARREGTFVYYTAADTHVRALLAEALSHADHAVADLGPEGDHEHRFPRLTSGTKRH